MYKTNAGQASLFDDPTNFIGARLNPNNRWVQISSMIPWDLLDEKYPKVAARVREHLETGWEPTLALLEQAMKEGVIRRVSLPVLQRMISASIEDFLADRTLDAQGISYTDALDEMISILLEGLLVR